MAAAVTMHLITIFAWMIWSFLNFFTPTTANYADPLILITLAHAILGTVAAALGVWLVAAWHFQTDVQKCFPRKPIMLITITLWLGAIVLGVVLYITVVSS